MVKIVVFISVLPNEPKTADYSLAREGWGSRYESMMDKKWSGVQTNEAPVKCLLDMASDNGAPVDEILCICTEDAKNKNKEIEGKSITAFAYFQEKIADYCKSANITVPKIKCIDYDEGLVAVLTREITDSYIESGDQIYIETTGGMRNIQYVLLLLAKIMEYKDVDFCGAVYSNFQKKELENAANIYQLFDVLNSCYEFATTGSSHSFERILENTEHDDIKLLVQSMKKFSDEMNLCRISRLDSILENLSDALGKVEKSELFNIDELGIFFKIMIPLIKEKMGLSKGKPNYIDIIRWCVNNNLIQQALTIYTEKMPEIFFEKGYLVYNNDDRTEANAAALFYSRFLDLSVNIADSAEKELAVLLKNEEKKKMIELNKDASKVLKNMKIVNENVKKAVERIFIIKEFGYYPDGNRKRYMHESVKDKYAKAVFEATNAKTFTRFMTFISGPGKKQRAMLMGMPNTMLEKVSIDDTMLKKFKTIDNMQILLCGDDCEFKSPLQEDTLKRICMDYLFFKWLRNNTNHAADVKEDLVYKRFETENYPVNDISVQSISECLKNAIVFIEEIEI